MRRSRRISKSLHTGGADTPIPDQPYRDPRTIHSIASLIRGKNKLLVLENPDTVEIYKLGHSTAISNSNGKDDIYLPVLKKSSSLTSIKSALSQSCSYLYDKRRGSFSSVTSQRTQSNPKTESFLREQREARKSNVVITMTYLGQGHRGSILEPTQDELKVLQQVNGGENICVFKGLVSPREQFQFVSQRHRGFPFSITLYINGIMVARFSSCCEYRYAPGFQQGRKSCFRLIWLAGGIPCYRCTSLRNKHSSCHQMSATNERLILPLEQNPANNTKPESTIRSSPSPPLFIPVKPVKESARRLRKCIKECRGGSTDSEGPAVIKETSKRNQRRGQTNLKSNKCNTAAKKMDEGRRGTEGTAEVAQQSKVADSCEDQASSVSQEETVTCSVREQPPSQETSRVHGGVKNSRVSFQRFKEEEQRHPQSRRKDFYDECVEMSKELEQSPNKHNWFKANMLERRRLQKRLSSSPGALESDVERSAESDTVPQCDEEPKAEEDATSQSAGKEEPVKEHDLQAQLDAMMQVLRTSDEVEQLVLRNTDLTDDLLLSLAGVLKSSPSEVTLLNLNLNLIGPYGAHILLDVLRAKPQVKGLHLFGNKLCDHGVLTLLNGIAEVQEQTARMVAAIQQSQSAQQNATLQLPTGWSSFKVFALSELDIGGNGLGSNGVKLLASYMRHYSRLQYLGLAQTSSADLAAWKELFDSLKGNRSLIHIILDENNLGDPGVRLLAEVLKENRSLRQVDLDKNGISDLGGNDIMGALLCRLDFPLRHLGLEENNISAGLLSRIQEEVKYK